MPGRRRAGVRPFEEGAATAFRPEVEDGAGDRTGNGAENGAVTGAGRGGTASPGSEDAVRALTDALSAAAERPASRPAARPPTRAPSVPPGPVLLPPTERPAARPPGSRRADRPALVGPAPAATPPGRRIAESAPDEMDREGARPGEVTPEVTTPDDTRSKTQPLAVSAAPAPPAGTAPGEEPTAVLPVAPVRQARTKVEPRRRAEPAARSVPKPEPRPRATPEPARTRTRTRGWLDDPGSRSNRAGADTATTVVGPAEPARRAERAAIVNRIKPAGTVPTILPGTALWTWLTVVLVGCAGVLVARANPDLPSVVRQASGAAIVLALAVGLAVRTGGRPLWAGGLSTLLLVGTWVTDWDPLRAGASVGTGVLAACLAIMVTVPAATFAIAIREAAIATAVAWAGALGVLAFGPDARPLVDVDRFGYAVLGLSLVGAFALVFRLGAGLHGLGRRGYAVAVGAVIMLVIAMAYTEALAQWGSRDLTGSLDDVRDSLRSTLGAVPHPIMALLGYPALLWGVFMRARRRQGWWVTAFGVAATAPTASRLVTSDLGAGSIVLGAVYSLLLGAVLGYLVIRVEQSFTGSHGRRARRDEEAVAHRPEPGRIHPLH